MSPTSRAAWLLTGSAFGALLMPPAISFALVLAVLTATLIDAITVRTRPKVHRTMTPILSRGIPAVMKIGIPHTSTGSIRLRQSTVPDISIEPQEVAGDAQLSVLSKRRGVHELPPVAVRSEGPLGLGSWYHRYPDRLAVRVYPNLHAARRIALAVRTGRFANEGRLTRGPLGLGTDFESIRDYLPDDDIRQVNPRASARLGRPMSNQYRVEQDRDVVCLVDCGRLMAAPIGDRTRLDAALDAAVAIALVADVLGDRCGAVAFDSRIRRRIRPERRGGAQVVHGLFDLEPSMQDTDFEQAFRSIGGGKRTLIILLTDVIDEAAAASLLAAAPVIARRHVVVAASISDPELAAPLRTMPVDPTDVYAQAVALDILDSRRQVLSRLRHSGASIVEAEPHVLAEACVRAYLTSKSRARL